MSADSLATPQEHEAQQPQSFAELLEFAGSLTRVVVGETSEPAAALDAYPESGTWAKRTWRVLLALESYVLSKEDGFAGHFRSWCLAPPDDRAAIPHGWVALRESDTTTSTTKHHDARVFEVPFEVAQEGRVYMEAHVNIVPGGWPAPRLHFLDNSTGAKPRVYVGYIGPHLPNGQTN